jgi:hydrogenase 3 maturation protease
VSLELALSSALEGRVALVGIGNRLRGDDGVGSVLAGALIAAGVPRVFDAEELPESVVSAVAATSPDTVLLVDAVDLGSEPGSAALIDRDQTSSYVPTTHRVPAELLMEVLERATGARCLLLGVQPAATGFALPMSASVRSSLELLTELLVGMLGSDQPPGARDPREVS